MTQLSIADLQKAQKARDPQFTHFISELAKSNEASEHSEDTASPLQEYFETVHSETFRKLPALEQARFRKKQFERIENSPLSPKRYRIYPLVMSLWETPSPYARHCLKELIAHAPLSYGIWKAFKSIYKDAQSKHDTDIFGALVARLDHDLAQNITPPEVSMGTLRYLVRRGWRYLRLQGQFFSNRYCQSAVDFLKAYPEGTPWRKVWVASHIFYHASGHYNSRSFNHKVTWGNRLRHRAFKELWKNTPLPLLTLLEEAQATEVQAFAVKSLKKEHTMALRDFSEERLLRLLKRQSPELDSFCVWLLKSIPKFEQAQLKTLGLHEAVLQLFHSQSSEAISFVVTYARSHAKDLPLETLLTLLNHHDKEVREFAISLLLAKDPRKEVGLQAWTRLLGSYHGDKLAQKAILAHFSTRDLTQEWFRDALLKPEHHAFASQYVLKFHPLKTLSPDFFISLFESPELTQATARFLMGHLKQFPFESLPLEFLKKALYHKYTRSSIVEWVRTGHCDSDYFGTDFLLTLACEPDWKNDAWAQAFVQNEKLVSRGHYPIVFDLELSTTLLEWLSDVRKFQPKAIGHQRLMQWVKSTDARYHDYASQYMLKAFTPSDFAPQETKGKTKESGPIDLEEKSFVFTGKLKTMTRSEAQKKVKEANGKKGSGVSKNLDYLVIGDEGSPFYGGKKGSKQLKGEALIEKGAALKIISETAFLQMLAGRKTTVDGASLQAGCKVLWDMLVQEKSIQKRKFSIKYIRQHHLDIAPLLTDRPVDPGAEIPHDFLSFEQVSPLFYASDPALIDLGIELAHWEAHQWTPEFRALFQLCEKAPNKVQHFLRQAFISSEPHQVKTAQFKPELVDAQLVYALCESPVAFCRQLGMGLLNSHPQLAEPEALFRLTESTDKDLRFFAVQAIWRRYKNPGFSQKWLKTKSNLPTGFPAEAQAMQFFLKRMLFELPPGRKKDPRGQARTSLPTCKAKIALIETYRQFALEHSDFAFLIAPVLSEFMSSKGKLEERACLVALVQLSEKHPDLSPWKEPA